MRVSSPYRYLFSLFLAGIPVFCEAHLRHFLLSNKGDYISKEVVYTCRNAFLDGSCSW